MIPQRRCSANAISRQKGGPVCAMVAGGRGGGRVALRKRGLLAEVAPARAPAHCAGQVFARAWRRRRPMLCKLADKKSRRGNLPKPGHSRTSAGHQRSELTC